MHISSGWRKRKGARPRLEETYTNLGIYLSRFADWARSVRPLIGPVDPPDQLPTEERWQV
jgi:hypothetical protein